MIKQEAMQIVIDKFLKAKHWQLFALMFGFPLMFQIIIMGVTIAKIESGRSSDSMLFSMQIFPVIMIIYMALFFGWFWSIAIGLQKKYPSGIKMKVKKFKIFFLIPLIYMTIISILIGLAFMGAESDMISGHRAIGSMVGVIVPFHFLSMFCMFYILYFVSKTIKTVELQREVSFSDFAGEFFLLWFYPIGIWIIQPRINKIIRE